MNFEQTPGANKNPKWKYYTKIGLLAFSSLFSKLNASAQNSNQISPRDSSHNINVDIGKGTYEDPWKYKLPKAEEDPLIAQVNRANKNPELIQKAREEMVATVRKKRSDGEKNIPVDKLAEYRAHTEALIFEIVSGSTPVDIDYENGTGEYASRKKDQD